jgi:hypothetical protein
MARASRMPILTAAGNYFPGIANIRHLAQSMCCIEQTIDYQKDTNTTAPPASQNLVKGGSP